jgi:hypothetical protein
VAVYDGPMPIQRLVLASMCSVLMLGACTPKSGDSADGVAVLQPGKTAASLRLDAVVELVEGEAIADAQSLETKINDPEAGLSAVDIDEDGEVDFIEVVEVSKNGKTTLELRAIPSSKKDQDVAKVAVPVATVDLHIEKKQTIIVHAVYTEHIEHDETIHVYHHEFPANYEHGVLVVEQGCFFHYAFVLPHEVYLGHHHVVIIEAPQHHFKHKKHKKHGKHHGKHKGHHGYGHGTVVVTY